MAQFYLLTHRVIVGPLTGIELREAALAGILHHRCVVGGAPTGPWHHGSEIGLFSEHGVPSPHPPEVEIPKFHVKRSDGANQGPFKLRELIGMAARGMLPPDAELCELGSTHWVRADSMTVLQACLNGNLVLVSSDGNLCQQTAGIVEGVDPAAGKSVQFYAPIDLPEKINLTEARTSENARRDAAPKHDQVSAQTPSRPLDFSLDRKVDRDPAGAPLRSLLRRFRDAPTIANRLSMVNRRIVAAWLVVLLLIPISAWAVSRALQLRPTRRIDVLGDWIVQSDADSAPRLAISFDNNGNCVIFNRLGDSWTGDFVWQPIESEWSHSTDLVGFESKVDDIEPGHRAGPIRPTDGYVLLRGFARVSPQIDGHPIRDLFLRREGEQLQLGYLSEIAWDGSEKVMTAGWIVAKRTVSVDASAVELALKDASRSDPEPSRGDQSRVFEAIESLRSGDQDPGSIGEESLVASETIDRAFLLRSFGVPDEARKVFQFELAHLPPGHFVGDEQIARYGDLVITLRADGSAASLRIRPPGRVSQSR